MPINRPRTPLYLKGNWLQASIKPYSTIKMCAASLTRSSRKACFISAEMLSPPGNKGGGKISSAPVPSRPPALKLDPSHHAAAGLDIFPGHPARRITGKEQGHVSDIFRRADAIKGRQTR